MEELVIDSPEKAKEFVEKAPRNWLVEFIIGAHQEGYLKILSYGLDTMPLDHLKRMASAAIDNINEEAKDEANDKTRSNVIITDN